MTTNIHLILEREHLENLVPLFEKQGVTDEILDTITDEDLRTLGVEKLGERRRVLLAFGEGSGGPFDLTAMAQVGGGILPQDSEFSGQKVQPFRIGKYPVTQLEWERVRIWAMAHGFKLEAGEGNGSRHPITHVSWYDAIKWCNAKSSIEELQQVYSINGKIYHNGEYGPDGSTLVCPPVSLRAKAYPAVGELPSFAADNQQTDTLPFLSDDIQQACLCIGGCDTGQSAWKASWYGRQAMSNEQYWSATKYLQVLDVVCQANRKDPQIHISDCRIHSQANLQKPTDLSFDELLVDMVSYRKGVPQSNAIALMFKWLSNPGEPNVQEWISNLTGNDDLQFLGKYGSDPFFADPELYADSGPLVRSTYPGTSGNYVSAYDLVRAITMLGWHNLLAPASKLPGAQWHSLASVIKGLGTDCARYLDVALQELGLDQVIQSPVIISKLGFGTTGNGEDALTYVALMSCIDPRPVPRKLRTFAFALRIPTTVPRATSHDAKMASEVTELVRRVFSDALT